MSFIQESESEQDRGDCQRIVKELYEVRIGVSRGQGTAAPRNGGFTMARVDARSPSNPAPAGVLIARELNVRGRTCSSPIGRRAAK